jgi:hypothetical protein
MPNHMRTYNCIDDALRSQIIHFIFNEGLSYPNTSERYSYETTKSITKALKKMFNPCLNTKAMFAIQMKRWVFSMISMEASHRFSPSTSEWSFWFLSYFTCTFFTKFIYNEYIGPYSLSHVVLKISPVISPRARTIFTWEANKFLVPIISNILLFGNFSIKRARGSMTTYDSSGHLVTWLNWAPHDYKARQWWWGPMTYISWLVILVFSRLGVTYF